MVLWQRRLGISKTRPYNTEFPTESETDAYHRSPRPIVLVMEAARTTRACATCRERKIKCSGTQPCRYCTQRRRQCNFPENVRKKLYSVDYVQELEAKAASLQILETSKSDNIHAQALGHPGVLPANSTSPLAVEAGPSGIGTPAVSGSSSENDARDGTADSSMYTMQRFILSSNHHH